MALFVGRARADEDPPPAEHHEEAPAAEHHEEQPAAEHHEEAAPAEHHEEQAADHHEDADHHEAEHHEEAAEHHEEAAAAADSDDDADPEDAHYSKFDLDGDGKADPALEKEYDDAFGGIKPEIDSDAVDKELDARPKDAELTPSLSIEQFRKIVAVARKVVLAKMEKKMAKSTAKKMAQFSKGIGIFSLAGLLLLLIPLVYAKRYPGKGGTLLKYSALAAITFLVTVNLFGGVLYGMKTVQSKLGDQTNPSLAIAKGTFDTLDENADEFLTMGKELFAPTLEQLQGNTDEQPSVLILENGKKIVKQANVFVSIAKMFKKLDFIFKVLPIILFAVTMILFGLAIKPTLTEIVKLPMRAASGEAGVGREVTANAMRRVFGEFKAALCTIAVLAVMTLLSGFVLGKVATPALFTMLRYFSAAVSYLQFVEGASAGLVFLALFGVILFLVLSLASLILSMSFFLGKCQKIFQARFNNGVPISTHAHFWRWGIPSVLLVQLFPWFFVAIAAKILDVINDKLLSGVKDADAVPWTKLMLAGPLFLVVGYIALFWAARGLKAIGFLFRYKIPK
ncbi:MAG: hypothetical protein QM831_20705 [Kofleriaceae bacterium]